MTAKAKAKVGYVCLLIFIAALILYAWIRWSNQLACQAIEQYAATTFRTEPTEVIYPHFGAVQFIWNDMTYVVEQSTWLYMTGAGTE